MASIDYVQAECGVRLAQARYADAVFRQDYDSFGDCLTDAGEWRVGGHVLRGRSECVTFLQQRMAVMRWVLMTFRTPILELQDQSVSSRTSVTEQSALLDGGNASSVATYYERFAFQDGLWRRSWAFFQLHYIGPADLSGRFFERTDYGPPPAMPPADSGSAAIIR